MKILVTGHHGYIGSVLCPTLAAASHDVVGLDSFFYRRCTFGEEDGAGSLESSDVRDVVPADLEGFDAIVHLAALSNDPLGDLNPAWTSAINRDSTIALARAAIDAGVRRFVFASSCAIYGVVDGDHYLSEIAPVRPLTAYAESKVAAEEGLWKLVGPDFVPVAMRSATVYGASPRLRLDVVLNNLVAWAHTTGAIRLSSDGSSWRPLVHVRDVAQAALALLEAPDDVVRGEAFNIGSAAQNYRIRDLAETVGRCFPSCRITYEEGATADPRSYRVDFSKFESTFPECRFAWTAERGAEELARAYERVGLTSEDFVGDRYTRLGELGRLIDTGALDEDLRWTGRPRSSS